MAKENLQPIDVLKEGLEKLIKETLKSSQKMLTEQEVKDIVKGLIPDLDQMIANKIKEHLIIIAEFIQEKFEIPIKKE